MAVLIETFKTLGGQTLFLTNAAGGLHTEWTPPALVAITDHINFAGVNPLIGRASDDRFVPLTRAYDPALAGDAARRGAATPASTLREGVYMWFNGPSFETPAEIRMAKMLGADLVGMSTVPEVILARLHGLALRRRQPRHQFRRRALRRRSQPRGDAGIRRARLRASSAACCAPSSEARALMLPQEIIRAKRDGATLTREEIAVLRARPHRSERSPKGRSPPSRWRCSFAAWTSTSASHLTRAMMRSGDTLDWPDTAGPGRRQTFDRRRRRQCQPDAGADARRLRRLSCR